MAVEREVAVKIGAKTYSIRSDDDNYLDYITGDFEPDMAKLFACFISPESHVLDVGANIGCTSILFGSLARSVASFEPSPTTFAFLSRNVASAGMNNVQLYNFALGATPGEFELTFAPQDRSGGFVSNKTKANAGHVTERIQVETLDTFTRLHDLQRVDFMKIDVEGFEQRVLEGGRDAVQRLRPAVVLELNHWCLNAFQRITVPDFFDFLKSVFPIVLAVDGNTVLDLRRSDDSYIVMYNHIIHRKFRNLVGAFDEGQLARFRQALRR